MGMVVIEGVGCNHKVFGVGGFKKQNALGLQTPKGLLHHGEQRFERQMLSHMERSNGQQRSTGLLSKRR